MKTIIFDFDGVIHDTMEDLHRVHCDTLEDISLQEMKDKVFGGNPRKYISKFSDKEIEKFDNAWKQHYEDLRLERNIRKELELLSKKYELFIISSNNEYSLNRYFENNNFLNIFKAIYGAETHISKVEKFKILLDKFNLNTEDCIFITDTLGDILEANEVGIKTIAVEFGFHERKKLEKGKPFKIVSSFENIRKLIIDI